MSGSGDIVEVRGGSHGLEVQHQQARRLARSYADAGTWLRDQAVETGRAAVDGDLVESAVLSPATFADAEAAVLRAASGPDGLLPGSLAWEADALVVDTVVDAFEASDALVAASVHQLDYALGRAAGTVLATQAVDLAVVALLAAGAARLLPADARRGLQHEASGGLASLQVVLERHPGLVEHVFDGGGGLVDGFWSSVTAGAPVPAPDGHRFHPTLESAAALLAGSFPADGPVRVRPHPVTGDPDPVTGAPSRVDPVAPAGVHDLVANLRQVAALSDAADSDHNGTVAVQTITTEAGRRHVVYLPGTDDLTTRPWSQDDDLRDGHTNLEAVSGIPTSYAEGVREAMRQAGVAPGEPVLLVGHSQGGMVAGEVARHPGDFAVTDVVTAGAPIGGQPPPEVRVLSLENTGDVVPLVDGAPNGQDAHHVTVRFDGRQGTVLGDHDYPAYELGARAVDASADPSVRDAVDGLSGFLGADDPGEVRVFRLTRGG